MGRTEKIVKTTYVKVLLPHLRQVVGPEVTGPENCSRETTEV